MKKKNKQILSIQRILVGNCTHTVKVTRICDGWNIRVFLNDVLNQEVKVFDKSFIGSCIASMLRIEDKNGNISNMATKSRERNFCNSKET